MRYLCKTVLLLYCTVKRINGSNESVVLFVYFVYLSCVIVYKMLFTGLTNGRCKRFYDGELPPSTCDDGVSSSVEVMVATKNSTKQYYFVNPFGREREWRLKKVIKFKKKEISKKKIVIITYQNLLLWHQENFHL